LSKRVNWIEIATNINLSDQRSLLGGEISGIKSYHTEIAVAGSGTNITNLPAESPPPSEAQLNNQSINQVQLDEVKGGTDEEIKEIVDKSVYIYHSHSWEAFNPLLKNNGSHDAASRNEKVNVLAVGNKLKVELAKRGIGAVQDKTDVTSGLKERNWNYTQSYVYSRERVQEAMAQNNHLNYLIDIHRDSQPKEVTTKTINGKQYARLFFVVGKENKNFQENLATAKELNQKLEETYPGISRGVFIKTKSEGNGVYNQDLTERAMLLEFGGVDNNLTELYNSIEAFAEVFSDYYWKDAEEVNA
jgi:stage II sporulation protein P